MVGLVVVRGCCVVSGVWGWVGGWDGVEVVLCVVGGGWWGGGRGLAPLADVSPRSPLNFDKWYSVQFRY